jgi:hypothetical protein
MQWGSSSSHGELHRCDALRTDGPISSDAREHHVRLDKFVIGLPNLLGGGRCHYIHYGTSINQHAGHGCAVQVPTNVQWLQMIL